MDIFFLFVYTMNWDWKKEKRKCMNRIIVSIKNEKSIGESFTIFSQNLPHVEKEEAIGILKIINEMMLIKFNKRIVSTWRKIIEYYKCKEMMDLFFDFYWITRSKQNIASEIVLLYDIFGIYFYKYMREMQNIKDFVVIVENLNNSYLQKIESLKSNYASKEL